MSSMRDFLPVPDREEKTVIIQARVTPEMRARVREIARKNKWNPSEVVRAGLEHFLNDEKALHVRTVKIY